MAGELEERQESPAPQPEPRAAVVEAPTPVVANAAPVEIEPSGAADSDSTADAGNDIYMSQGDALRKNPGFQARSYGMADDGPQAKNDNGLSARTEPVKLRADEIALGGSQNNGANAIRANLMTSHKDVKTSAVEAQQARARSEALRIAQWNATMTMVGGIQMTNEQAQNARRDVIENGDKYADWAVKKGLIKEEDKEKFKQTAKEMYELKEKEKLQGKMTPEQQKRFDDLQGSVIGHAVDKATAESHNVVLGKKMEANAQDAKSVDQSTRDAYNNKTDMNIRDQEVVSSNSLASKSPISAANIVSESTISSSFDLNADFTNAATAAAPNQQQNVATLDNKAKPAVIGLG